MFPLHPRLRLQHNAGSNKLLLYIIEKPDLGVVPHQSSLKVINYALSGYPMPEFA